MTERDDLPLLAFGTTREAARVRCRRLTVRAAPLALLAVALTLTVALPPRPRLVWNASASAPIGLYAVATHAAVVPGEMVIARVPERFRMLAAVRHYLPTNVPLVKRVRAAAGDRVCARGATVTVNGRVVATRRAADARGRAMPHWQGCTSLRAGALLLLMDHPDSFDGRYFGPTAAHDIVGTATLLWRW